MPGAYLHGYDETTGEPVMCRVTADGKLIVNAASIVENPPTEDLATKAPTSEWAYDHDANPNAHHTPTVAGDLNHNDLANIGTDDHHAKYTDTESRAAIGDLFSSTGISLKDINLAWYRMLNISYMKFMTGGANRYVLFYPPLNSTNYLRIALYKVGVGYGNAEIRLYKTNQYKLVIDQDNFQAELDNYLENPPTEDVADKAPTSEWAFDHNADASRHHAKYTHKEAVDSFGGRSLTLTNGTYDSEDVSAKNMIYLDTTGGDIILRGLGGGYDGQIIFGVKTVATNDVYIYHEHATPAAGNKIRTLSAINESLQAGHYGGFTLVYKGSYWHSLGYVA